MIDGATVIAVASALVFVFTLVIVIRCGEGNKKRTVEGQMQVIPNDYPFLEVRTEFTGFCQSCGLPITDEETRLNNGLCEDCMWEEEEQDEDSDLFLSGAW